MQVVDLVYKALHKRIVHPPDIGQIHSFSFFSGGEAPGARIDRQNGVARAAVAAWSGLSGLCPIP